MNKDMECLKSKLADVQSIHDKYYGSMEQFSIDFFENVMEDLNELIDNFEYKTEQQVKTEISSICYKIENILNIVMKSIPDYDAFEELLIILRS